MWIAHVLCNVAVNGCFPCLVFKKPYVATFCKDYNMTKNVFQYYHCHCLMLTKMANLSKLFIQIRIVYSYQ